MNTIDWRHDQFRCWAVVAFPNLPGDGVGPIIYESVALEVTSFAAHFDLNSIPSCEIQVALGYRADTGVLAALHTRLEQLRILLPIQVWLHASTLASAPGVAPSEWRDRPIPLFDGYVVAVGRDHTFGSSRLTLSLTHWLSDLAFSSAFSRSSGPTNPVEFYFGANFRVSSTGARSLWSSDLVKDYFTPASIARDFWGRSLVYYLTALCSQDRLQVPQIGAIGLRDKNYEALRALTRFEGFNPSPSVAPDPDDPVVPYQYSKPLVLNTAAVRGPLLARAIGTNLISTSFDSLATTTIWDKLAGEWAGQYLFSVVPMISRALVVPFIPGLRNTWRDISPNEYDALRLDAVLPRPVRGIGVTGGIRGVSGATGQAKPPPGLPGKPLILGVGAYFENTDPLYSSGMVLFRRLPEWLYALASPDGFTRLCATPNGVRSMAAAPAASTSFINSIVHQNDVVAARSVWTEYARALYYVEILRHRRLSLRTRFRLDIAPGSSIHVNINNDPQVQAQLVALGLGPGQDLYGHVARVSICLSSEDRQAYTLLGLSHVRSRAENVADATSTNSHPLWNGTFTGAPLSEIVSPVAEELAP
jgi:hypothetical protein